MNGHLLDKFNFAQCINILISLGVKFQIVLKNTRQVSVSFLFVSEKKALTRRFPFRFISTSRKKSNSENSAEARPTKIALVSNFFMRIHQMDFDETAGVSLLRIKLEFYICLFITNSHIKRQKQIPFIH